MAALGFTVARWFVFGDGRSGILYDDRGLPTGHRFAICSPTSTPRSRSLETRASDSISCCSITDGCSKASRETIADPATGALFEVASAGWPFERAAARRIGRESLLRGVFEPLLRRYGTQR